MSELRDSQIQWIYRRSALFSVLRRLELDALLGLAGSSKVPPRYTLCHKGYEPEFSFPLTHDSASVTAPSRDAKKRIRWRFEPGEAFGEVAVLDGREHTTMVSASELCDVPVRLARGPRPVTRPEGGQGKANTYPSGAGRRDRHLPGSRQQTAADVGGAGPFSTRRRTVAIHNAAALDDYAESGPQAT